MSRMIKRLMVVLVAVFMFVGMVTTPVHAESASEEPAETPTEEVATETEASETTETPELAEGDPEPSSPEVAEEGFGENAEAPALPEDISGQDAPADADTDDQNTTTDPVQPVMDDALVEDAAPVEDITETIIEKDAVSQPAAINNSKFTSRSLRASTPKISAGKSVTDQDKDGIYELALTVTGQSQQSSSTEVNKFNVVLVIDVSGSMANFDDSYVYYDTYTYDASTYNDYHYYTSSENMDTRLYYGDYYVNYGGWWQPDWRYAGTGWYSGNANGYGGTAYSGTVYAYETRLEATKRAACALVDNLLANNDPNNDQLKDVIEISVIKFAALEEGDNTYGPNGTVTIISKSTSGTDIKNAINGLTAGGGTNWSAALKQAKSEADTKYKPEAGQQTSVIFLTDGLPTLYLNSTGESQRGNGQESEDTGWGTNYDNVRDSFNNAKPYARAVIRENGQDTGYTFYSIFAFGSDSGALNGARTLNNLTRHAYTGNNSIVWNTDGQPTDEHFFNAQDTSDLEEAFESIAHTIQNSVGFAGVDVTDGVSLGATNTSLAVSGTIDTSSLRYHVSKNTDLYDVHIENGVATFTIYGDGEPTVLKDEEAETGTITINDESIPYTLYSVTDSEGKKYMMCPAIIDEDGMIKWDLSGMGILEDGVTYKLAFDVWANQKVYDIAADLNNHIYASVEEALDKYGIVDDPADEHDEYDRIRAALHHNEDGSYSIETNYHQQVDFYPAESRKDSTTGEETWNYGDKVEQPLDQPPAIPLLGSSLPLVKDWKKDLKESEYHDLLYKKDGTPTEYGITLHVWKADKLEDLEEMTAAESTADPYQSYELGWDSEKEDYVWQRAMAVAPGMMVNLTKARQLGFDIEDTSRIVTFTPEIDPANPDVVPEPAQYYIVEPGHYYTVTEEGSDLHFELKSHIYRPMIIDGKLYDATVSGNTLVSMIPMASVTAENYLKGGLNIEKVVSSTEITSKTDENGKIALDGITTVDNCEDEFAFRITLWNNDEGEISPVYTFDDQFGVDGNPNKAISGSIGYREFGKIINPENGDRELLGRNVILFESSDNAEAKIAANKQGDNEPVYAKNIDNKTVIELTIPACGEIMIVNLPAGTNYTVEEIVDDDPSYTFAGTGSYTQPVREGDEITYGTTNNVSGSINGNTASVERFYNFASCFYVYHSSDNTVEKINMSDKRVAVTYVKATADKPAHYEYKFNIVNETKKGYFYGGYYKGYGQTESTDEDIKALDYTSSDTKQYEYTVKSKSLNNWASDSKNCQPYTGPNANGNNTDIWNMNDEDTGAYTTESGDSMRPVANTVYYLKEVPEAYLEPATYVVYDKNDVVDNLMKIKKLYLMSLTDDGNYKSVGFDVTLSSHLTKAGLPSGQKTAEYWSKQIEVKKNDATIDTLFASSIQHEYHGLIFANDVRNYIKEKAYYREIPYWITPDEVKVTGKKQMIVLLRNTRFSGDWKSPGMTKTAANKTPAYKRIKSSEYDEKAVD